MIIFLIAIHTAREQILRGNRALTHKQYNLLYLMQTIHCNLGLELIAIMFLVNTTQQAREEKNLRE